MRYQGRRFLVTGGAGFIGSHIAEAMWREGAFVRVLDNLSTGSLENVARVAGLVGGPPGSVLRTRGGIQGGERFEFIEGDVRDQATVRLAASGMEVIFHQAALPSVARSITDPAATWEVNVGGTLNVLMAARAAGVRRVVLASSSSVYGDSPVLPKHEDLPVWPKSPYAASKVAAEALCRSFAGSYGVETVCLRYFNVYGPRQDPASEYAAVIPRFIKAGLAGVHPTIYGDGLQSRDFTYVGDVVRANRLALNGKVAAGTVCNIARGHRESLLALVRSIAQILGREVVVVHEEPRPGDVRHSLADVSRAKALLGFEAEIPLHEGLRYTVRSLESTGTPTVRNSKLPEDLSCNVEYRMSNIQ